MPLKIAQRKLEEIPVPTRAGKVNPELEQLKEQMRTLTPGSALEVDLEGEKDARRVKALITRAARELGARWRHWSLGSKVYAVPESGERPRRRGKGRRPRQAE